MKRRSFFAMCAGAIAAMFGVRTAKPICYEDVRRIVPDGPIKSVGFESGKPTRIIMRNTRVHSKEGDFIVHRLQNQRVEMRELKQGDWFWFVENGKKSIVKRAASDPYINSAGQWTINTEFPTAQIQFIPANA